VTRHLVLLACAAACSPSAKDSASPTSADTTPPTETATPTGPDGWALITDDRADLLQSKLEQAVVDLDLVGGAMGLAYAEERELWIGAAGLSDVATDEAWTPDRRFHIGSVSKTFTAAIVFELASEGALGLDDDLERWVPGYYDGAGVTLRHLLSHTSGIVSYNYVGSFDSTRPWTPEELVAWAVDNEPELRFEPGTAWEYSNTNFVLLGLVIEAATGATFADELDRRLLGPLALDDTYLALSGNVDPAIVSCYDVDGTDLTHVYDPSFGWAAGGMVSTPYDLARWGALLYGGDVLAPEALEQMLTQLVLPDGTVIDYGLGAFIETDGVDAIYGHTGGYSGYLTYLYYWQADGLSLAVMSNELETDLRDMAGYGWSVPLDLDYP
jgi:D-alanyl-D-alanine carboxypeptidase